MIQFSFQHSQLVSICASLIADELARRFGRYTETLTLSKWHSDTVLGRGGIEANSDQVSACASRISLYFRDEGEDLTLSGTDTLGSVAERVSDLLRAESLAFRFHPSTQSGDAETRHSADDIWQDASAVASLMQGRRRAISLVHPHSLIGLVAAVLAPNLQGLEVIDGRVLSPDQLSGRLAFGDLVIATPTLWRYLADTLPDMASNVMGLSFGERLGADLVGRLRQRGLGAMRELYGSTETGVLAWRDSSPDPFVLFDHWTHRDGALVRQRPSGRETSLIPMDDLDWEGRRTFQLGKRRDGAVQIGAVNVFPQAIASVIAEHPGVKSCVVRVAQRSGALDRLITDITLTEGRSPDQAMAWSIDEWCRKRLRPAERPRIYSFYMSDGQKAQV